jgi:hypothetical protein
MPWPRTRSGACLAAADRAAGMNLNNMSKMLKCAGNNDSITMKAEDSGDVVTFLFESEGEYERCSGTATGYGMSSCSTGSSVAVQLRAGIIWAS